MRYSRFDQKAGLYDVWEDASAFALNGDLPKAHVGPVIKGIAATSLQSGYTKPSGAKYVGRSWHPHGLIIPATSSQGLGGIPADSLNWAVPLLVAGAVLWMVWS